VREVFVRGGLRNASNDGMFVAIHHQHCSLSDISPFGQMRRVAVVAPRGALGRHYILLMII
jgi:hypothetical protein